jgi:serine/threonine protein kinase
VDDEFQDDLTEIDETGFDAEAEALPDRIGHYRLLQKLGEGGMGEVWEAEQSEPVRRRVALKVIKLGMDTKQVVARFEAERQALAVMDHPSIAHVYDAGATEAGRPFFVMELVRGVPITQYCDRHTLSLHDRLELFIQVCHAIQHAHQKGVIHRDLKPSNILVGDHEGLALPKIIDFGVAKAAGQQLTEKTLFTVSGQLVGTPEYMSPEQADFSGMDIDTRTDIYSLGVVLYDLLTGDLPFGKDVLRKAGFIELQRKIRQEDPPRPSTRLTVRDESAAEIAQRRQTDPGSLAREVRGDLDWIVMKALEKDRARRYETANALAADIRRFLDHEPIEARPPSTGYRALKFVRRNRLGVALASLLAFALIAGSIGTAVGFFRSQQEAHKATTITEFVTEKLLSEVDPEKARGRDVTVREVLDEAAVEVETAFADEPALEAELRAIIGSMYSDLGFYDEGTQHLGRSVELFTRTLGPRHRKTIEARNLRGRNHLDLKQFEAAAALWEELLPAARKTFGADHLDTLTMMHNLVAAYLELERYDQAEPLLVDLLEARRRKLGDKDMQTTATINNLAHLYLTTERYEQAEPLFREALAIRREIEGDHPRTLISAYNLGNLYSQTDRHEQAEPLYREALEGFERVYGQDHPYVLLTINSLARNLISLERFPDAEALAADSYERHRARYGPDDEEVEATVELLAELYEAWGRPEQAAKWRDRLSGS